MELSELRRELNDLGQSVERLSQAMVEDIKELRSKIPIQCKLGHWNPKDEVCPYCAKLETDIIADNCDDLTDKEKCEDGLCDCDKGECVARTE